MAKTDFEKKFKLPEGFEKDFESRVKIKEAISKFFKSKNLKVPNLEKRGIDPRTGKKEKGYYSQLVTSDYRPSSVTPGHRLYGGLDIAAGILGPHQEDFVDFMLKEGFRVIDERKAVSRSKHFRRGIFHIDDHPTEKGVLREEIPQRFKEGDKGTKVAIDGEFWRLHPKKGTGGYKIIKRVGSEGQEIKEPKKSFKQTFDEARSMGQKEFEFRGRRFNTRMKGESPEEFEEKFKFVDDQKFDSVKEFEQSKVDEKDKDITEAIMKVREDARKPEQKIEADDIELEQTIPMDQSVPFGIFARGTDEFRGAQEQAFAGAKGGEVNPRIPRKKGQPAKSKKHSDLYTDEDPRGTIQGLGFKDVPKAKSSVSKIRKSSRSHAHKVQAAVAMEQRAREMGKTSEAAVYRKFIDQMKERTKKMKKAEGGEINYQEGGEVKGYSDEEIEALIPDKVRVDTRTAGDYKKLRKLSLEEKAEIKSLLKTYDKDALDQIKRRGKYKLKGQPIQSQLLFSQMAEEIKTRPQADETYSLRGQVGERIAESDIDKQMDSEDSRDLREFSIRKDAMARGPKFTADPRIQLAKQYNDPSILKAPFRDPQTGELTTKFNPFAIAPTAISGDTRSQSEVEGRDVREKTKDVTRFRELRPVVRQYNPRDEQGNLLPAKTEIVYKQDKDFFEEGGRPVDTRETMFFADKGFKGKDRVGPVETPFEKAERAAMLQGVESPEYKSRLYDAPRDFSTMPKKARAGMRRQAGYGGVQDTQLRRFGEAFSVADQKRKQELKQANPQLAKEFEQRFQNGGEVDEQMAAFRAADAQSMQEPETEEFQGDPITSRDPIEGVPEIQGFVPKRQPDVQPDVDPEVQDLETRPDPFPKRERSPDAQGVREFQLSQMSVDDLMNMTTPGVGRPADVNRELARRKREFDGISLEKLAELDRDQKQREEDKKQKEEADRQKKERDKANKTVVEDKSQKELDEAELRKALDDSIVQAQKAAQAVDPKRFFKKMSTFDKIVGLIGLAAGAYESYKYGGPNFYEKEIEKEVEKDIKLQKLGLENEKRQLGVANFKVAQIARKLAMSTKNEEQRIRLLQTFQKFQQAGAKEVAAAQKQKGLMNVNFILNTRGITDAEMARFDSLYPGLKIRANSIKGRTGLNFFVRGGPSNLSKVKAYLADAQDSIDGLTDLYSYFDKISIIDQAVPIFSIDAAAAQSLRDRLVGKLRIEFFGPGVMTDSERAQAKRILGDPNALLTTDAREKPKILKLIMKLNYGVRDKLRRDGVAITKTPNDLRIEQMLSRRKLENNAKNRRFVIDALIQGEIDAQKAGKAPGSLWNMNEPLPV